MARIAGVNIPTAKRVVIALQYIHGIGQKHAKDIMEKSNLEMDRRVADLTDCLLYTSPSPRDLSTSRMPSSA